MARSGQAGRGRRSSAWAGRGGRRVGPMDATFGLPCPGISGDATGEARHTGRRRARAASWADRLRGCPTLYRRRPALGGQTAPAVRSPCDRYPRDQRLRRCLLPGGIAGDGLDRRCQTGHRPRPGADRGTVRLPPAGELRRRPKVPKGPPSVPARDRQSAQPAAPGSASRQYGERPRQTEVPVEAQDRRQPETLDDGETGTVRETRAGPRQPHEVSPRGQFILGGHALDV